MRPGAERVLSLRELNRALLARQLLLVRRRLPIPRAVERLCALQAQYSPSPYVALWSRLDGFTREGLTRAIERGSVIRATLVRGTLHLVSRTDYPFVASAVTAAQRGRPERRGADVDALWHAIRDEPASAPELNAIARDVLRVDDEWTIAFSLRALPLVSVPPAGTWRHHRAGLSRPWRDPLPSPRDGTAHLVRRCLAAFGPMSLEDLRHFTYVPIGSLRPALEPLLQLRSEDGRLLYDVPRGPLPPATTPAPVRFLPTFDSAILAHQDRARIIPAEYHETVIRKVNATTLATFLVDGLVAGSWRLETARSGATLVVEPFAPIPSRVRRELEAEGKALARFHEPGAPRHAARVVT